MELAHDVLSEELGGPLDCRPLVRTRSAPDPSDVARAADELVAAERPVIHAGRGGHWAQAYAELKELAELLAAPASTSLEGKGACDETHPLSPGSGGAAIRASCASLSTPPTSSWASAVPSRRALSASGCPGLRG